MFYWRQFLSWPRPSTGTKITEGRRKRCKKKSSQIGKEARRTMVHFFISLPSHHSSFFFRFLALFLRPFLILRLFPFHSPRPSSSPTSSSSPRPFPFSSPSSFTSPSSFSLFLPFVLSLPLFLYPFGITAHPCPFSRQVDFVV